MDKPRHAAPAVFAVVAFLLVALLSLCFNLSRQYLHRRVLEAEIEHQADLTVMLIERQLASALEGLDALAGLLLETPEEHRTERFVLLAPVLMELKDHFIALGYADHQGVLREVVGPGGLHAGTDLSDDPLYREVLAGGRPAWSPPVTGCFGVKLFLPIAPHQPVGLLVGEISLGPILAEAVRELAGSTGVGVEIEGVPVLSPPGPAPGVPGVSFHSDLLGRTWLFTLYPDPGPRAPAAQGAMIFSGLAAALVISVLVYLMLRRAKRTREREADFRLLAENARDIVYRMQLYPVTRFEYISPAVTAITGYTPEEYYADPLLALRIASPEHRSVVESLYAGVHDFSKPLVTRRTRKDGTEVWMEQRMTPFHNGEGRLVTIEGIIRDITEQKRLEEQLKHMGLHDSLTGLYNRAYFEEELRRLENGRAHPITILSLDVNRLKLVNDTMGHGVGDDLLRGAAKVLRLSLRQGDVVARIGGDEFAVILPRTDGNSAARLTARLKTSIEQFNRASPPFPLSLSLGMATAAEPGCPLEQTLILADREMYRDKMADHADAQRGMVDALLTSLETKDGGPAGHLVRVGELTLRMGLALGLKHRDLTELRLLAQVHDLGKVGMPDTLLGKPGPLTPGERAVIEHHAVLGRHIASASSQLVHIAELILHHHEWWNGQGYPDGLRGEAIPVACRILAIVDAYDAMTSERPYRQPMSHATAIHELRRCGGTQFDPELVDLFIDLVGE